MGDEEARAVYRKIDFDRLLQKCYIVDFLSKKRKVNEGEVQQYYIEKSHQPIIQPHEFDVVQAEFARRKGMDLHYSGGGVFSPGWSATTAASTTAPRSGTPTASTASAALASCSFCEEGKQLEEKRRTVKRV